MGFSLAFNLYSVCFWRLWISAATFCYRFHPFMYSSSSISHSKWLRRYGFAPLYQYAYPAVLDGLILLLSLCLLLKFNRSQVLRLFYSIPLGARDQKTILSSLASPQSVDSIIGVLFFRFELSLSLRFPPPWSIAFSLLLETSALPPSFFRTHLTVTNRNHFP